jgi:hypothetical protein
MPWAQALLSFFATLGATSGDIRLIQAFTFVLTTILVAVALFQPLIRPRILYKGHKSAAVMIISLVSSLITKIITRLLFLPVMQVRMSVHIVSELEVHGVPGSLESLPAGCV